jgi:tetratricopeptide (TPR) repeat protein
LSQAEFVQRGQVLIERRQYQEAVKVCRLGLLASPAEVEGRLVLAKALAALNRHDEVLAEMRVALELDPRNGRALALKARALLGKGDVVEARLVLKAARSALPGDPEVQELLSEAAARSSLGGYSTGRSKGRPLDDFSGESETRHYPSHIESTKTAIGAQPYGPDSGRPRGGGALDDFADESDTAHYAADAGITDPDDDLVPPPEVLAVGDRSGTIQIEPPSASATFPGAEYDSYDDGADDGAGLIEIDSEDMVAIPDGGGLDDLSTFRSAGDTMGSSSSPFASTTRRDDSGPPLDDMFPDEGSGLSSVELGPAAVSGSIQSAAQQPPGPRPRRRSSGQVAPASGSHPRASFDRSRREDMSIIKSGLGIDEAERSRGKVALGGRSGPRTRGQPKGTSRYRPLMVYSVFAVFVMSLAVVLGLRVRGCRDAQNVQRALAEADRKTAADTYRGYVSAAEDYATIRKAVDNPAIRAAQARVEAALAAEFGERLERAQSLVERLGRSNSLNAKLARLYLAVAQGDRDNARVRAASLLNEQPESPLALYLAGRAALLDERLADAAALLRKSLAVQPTPAAYVALGVVQFDLGRFPEARAAMLGAAALFQGHPAALIGQARIHVRLNDLPTDGSVEAQLRALIEAGKKPVAEQPAGVAPAQVGWAYLALAEVQIARGDMAAAKKSLREADLARPQVDDWRFSDGLAAAYYALGDLSAGDAEASAAVERWPKRASGRVRLAEGMLAGGNPDRALAVLEQIDGISSFPTALAMRGRAQLARGEPLKAIGDLDAALAERPGLLSAQVARAEAEVARGQIKEGLKRLAPLYQDGAPPQVAIVYGRVLRDSGDVQQARTVLQQAQQARPSAEVHIELARLARLEGDFAGARAEYGKALEANPEGLIARLETASLAFDTGDTSGAREALDALVGDAPDRWPVLVAAAQVNVVVGDVDTAAELLDRADKQPSASRALIARERGRLALRLGRGQDAVRTLKSAVELDPDDADSWGLLVQAYLEANDSASAWRTVNEMGKRFAKRADADIGMGRVYLFRDRIRDARVAFRNAAATRERERATPRQRSEAYYLLGRVGFVDGDLKTARADLKRALELDSSNADAYFTLGQVESERGNLPGAVKAYQRATTLMPKFIPEAWFLLGEGANKLGDKRTAQAALQRYLELAPKGDFAAEAERMLAGRR